MNYLKSKRSYFIAFSMVFAFIAFLMVGCEKTENIIGNQPTITKQQSTPDANSNFETKSSTLDQKSLRKLYIENKVINYLKDNGLKSLADQIMKDELVYEDIIWETHLNADQLVNFNDFMQEVEILKTTASACDCTCTNCGVECECFCNVNGNWYYTHNPCSLCPSNCGCRIPNYRFFDKEVLQQISFFTANELGEKGQELVHLYITHQNEINDILSSDDPKYQQVQTVFNNFWDATKGLIEKGFSGSSNAFITKRHIKVTNDLLIELEKVVTHKELKQAISDITPQITTLEGKELKKALNSFGQKENSF